MSEPERTVCWLCGGDGPAFLYRGGHRICTNCADQVARLEAENAQLRARLQAAENILFQQAQDLVADLRRRNEEDAMSTHIPGPWESFPWRGDVIAIRQRGTLGHICHMVGGGPGVAEMEANARLIAAAPDLLAALQEILPILVALDFREGDEEEMPIITRVRAALARATGASDSPMRRSQAMISPGNDASRTWTADTPQDAENAQLRTCWLCGTPSHEVISGGGTLISKGGSWLCTACADQVTVLESENAALRARCQAAESALHQLLDAAEDAMPMVSLIDDAACLRLAEVVRTINAGLPESPICTRCHRALVVPQTLDHVETPTGWVCMPCVQYDSTDKGRSYRGATP